MTTLSIQAIPKLKKRQTSVYWRPIIRKGETIWIETLPLPCDIYGKELYLGKGFRLEPPDGTPIESDNTDDGKEALYAEIRQLQEANKALKEKAKVAA